MLKKLNDAVLNIKQKKQDTATLEYLARYKTEIARNLGNGDYNKKVRLYDKLGQLEHSLYRYNEFIHAGMVNEAQKEGENFIKLSQNADGSIILKGGISNTRYAWRTEAGACKACQELDGKVFDRLEDVPERPHPNCKCEIEPLPEDNKNDEQCDCWQVVADIEDVIVQGENLTEEIYASIVQIQNTANDHSMLNSEYAHSLINDLISLEQPYNTLMQTISIFITNFTEMKDAATKYADKYFHAKANCEAAQSGILGEILAQALSDFREFTDNFRNIKEKHLSIEASLKDIEEDQEANREGRDLGHWHPLIDAYDLLKHRIPKGFPERYKKK